MSSGFNFINKNVELSKIHKFLYLHQFLSKISLYKNLLINPLYKFLHFWSIIFQPIIVSYTFGKCKEQRPIQTEKLHKMITVDFHL